MLKIAHISTTFNNASVYKWTRHLARDQKEQGWQVEFIAGHNTDPELMQQAIAEGFPVTRVPTLRKYIHPYYDARAVIDLTNLLKRKKFDVVHTSLSKAGVIGRLAAKLAGTKKIIHSVYGATFASTMPLAKRIFFQSLERLTDRISDHTVFCGRELRDVYLRAGIARLDKSSTIYLCFDFTPYFQAAGISTAEQQKRRQALGLGGDDIVLGMVSRLIPQKGHIYGLSLIKELKNEFPQIKLIIVGDAVLPSEEIYKQKLFRLVKEMGIEKQIIFTGWQSNPSFYYSLFDIYLLTSMPSEGLPACIMEAFCARVPVVGFECTGVRETVGEQTLLVPPKDLTALTGAVKGAILRLPEIRRQFGKNPAELEALQERHSPVRMVREYQQLYQALLA